MENIRRYDVFNVLLLFLICFILLKPFDSRADTEPFYNISVKIDPAITVYLNEKIEVYCEKDGQYFMIIDLNNSNKYEYKKSLENGIYTFQARVRYDQQGEYKVLPASQVIELTYKNNNVLNEIVFSIEGVTVDPDDHLHIYDDEEDEEENTEFQEERIFTIDDMDELLTIQESAVSEAEKAFAEREAWERNNSFLAQYGIVEQNVSDDNILSMHQYPETEIITGTDQFEENQYEDESPSTTEKESAQINENDTSKINTKQIVIIVVIILMLLMILVLVVIIGGRKRKTYG